MEGGETGRERGLEREEGRSGRGGRELREEERGNGRGQEGGVEKEWREL